MAGSPYTISAVLSPAGVLNNYTITSNTAPFTILAATASVTPNPASKAYGTADPAFTGTLSGFLPSSGVTASYSRTAAENVAGSPYAISATLSPSGSLSDYSITYNTAAFTITPATPIVTWADPADIFYPTALTSTQLNATANVPGAFAYTPAAGAVPSVGNDQPLSVLLTPTDNSNYTTATAQVHINVLSTDVSVVQTTPAARDQRRWHRHLQPDRHGQWDGQCEQRGVNRCAASESQLDYQWTQRWGLLAGLTRRRRHDLGLQLRGDGTRSNAEHHAQRGNDHVGLWRRREYRERERRSRSE